MVVLAVGFLDWLATDAISASTVYTSLKKDRREKKEIIKESSA